MEARIHIIGVGGDGLRGLTTQARELLLNAELVLGSDYALQLVPELKCERHPMGADLHEVVRLIEKNIGQRKMVVIATGDPLFYGVARFLCDRIGKDTFEVIPHVSSMQLAFARVKESWEEAYLTNLATHPLEEVIDRIRIAETVGLFPSAAETPPVIARTLLARDLDYFRAYVCENLGSPDERVTQGELAEIAAMEFAPLNVMILKRKEGRPDKPRAPHRFRRFGNPDDVFAQSQPKSGLITQAEVRSISLALLDIQPTSIVWDIGAGSGSVSIEAAQLAEHGEVYAIEQDAADYHLIIANAQTFGAKQVKAIHGSAPAVFSQLPRPDAIFVGGSKETTRLLSAAYDALKPGARMVVNLVTLEALHATYETLKSVPGALEVLLVQVARATPQLDTLRFAAVNPSFVVSVAKPRGAS